MKKFIVGLMLVFSMGANAGMGLSAVGVYNMARNVPYSDLVVLGGFSTMMGSIVSFNTGKPLIGLILAVLSEKELITTEDYDLINNADVATQEAFISIVTNEELSEDEKVELLAELQF